MIKIIKYSVLSLCIAFFAVCASHAQCSKCAQHTHQKHMESKMNIVLLGPPGSGKGTQAEIMKERFGLCHISTGDLLRSEVSQQTEIGKRIELTMKTGGLVDDETVLTLLRHRMLSCSNGMILDGFPRTIVQAELLDKLLSESGQKLDRVIYLDVPEKIAIDRIANRRTCTKCKSDKAAGAHGKCECLQFTRRADDDAESVKKRFVEYELKTKPLVDFYGKKALVSDVKADLPTPQEVYSNVEKILNSIRK